MLFWRVVWCGLKKIFHTLRTRQVHGALELDHTHTSSKKMDAKLTLKQRPHARTNLSSYYYQKFYGPNINLIHIIFFLLPSSHSTLMSVRSKASIAQPTLDELIKQGHFIRYSGLSVASQASSFELPEGDTVPIKSALDSRLQPYQQNGIANAAWACGADKLWREGYLGTGTVIGIIDNGCDLTAEPLQVCPDGRKKILSYYKDLKTTIEDYDEVYRNGSTGTPALWHGTSVASIAAGYSKDGYKGVAPGAQLRIYETLVDIEVAALLERP
jgi:subtilisin family serine protease